MISKQNESALAKKYGLKFIGPDTKKLIALTFFAIAMGLLEAAVVVYLRKLLYNGGFDFPVEPIADVTIALTEILREAATLVMLFAIGYIYGRNFITRFATFLFSFAVWDLFYYVFLKVLLDWPSSLFSWDVLFLIPVTWVSPVLAPVIVSFTMILYALIFLHTDRRNYDSNTNANLKEWLGFILGSIVILISFTIDPVLHMLSHDSIHNALNMDGKHLMQLMNLFIPETFRWWIFIIGEGILLLSIAFYYFRFNPCLNTLKPKHA